MALSNTEILDAIAAKSVLEVSELIKMMEDKFGVSAAPRRQRLKSRPNSPSFWPRPGRTRSTSSRPCAS
jgi:hypothetical protein